MYLQVVIGCVCTFVLHHLKNTFQHIYIFFFLKITVKILLLHCTYFKSIELHVLEKQPPRASVSTSLIPHEDTVQVLQLHLEPWSKAGQLLLLYLPLYSTVSVSVSARSRVCGVNWPRLAHLLCQVTVVGCRGFDSPKLMQIIYHFYYFEKIGGKRVVFMVTGAKGFTFYLPDPYTVTY